MKRAFALILMLAACREDQVQSTAPVPLTSEAVGHFCQMDLLEHPGPKAQVHLDGLPGKPLFFSQVRDAVAYSRLPEQSHPILDIWVNDMGAKGATWDRPGAENWIHADDAHYVVGSSREGGMGATELVPFGREQDALAFAKTNGGTVMDLVTVPDKAVIAPVAAGDGDAGETDFADRLRALSAARKEE